MTIASPDGIRKQLDELWTGLGQQSADGEGVLRACSMSLIVITAPDPNFGEVLGQLMHAHPARAIVVSLAGDAEDPLGARVQAECWLPFGRKQQICCERIEVSSGLDAARGIPGLVRALTAPDLPVVVYLRGAHGVPAAPVSELVALADKLVVESAGVSGVEESRALLRGANLGAHLGDLSWTRLTRWRAMLAQRFDEPAQRAQLDLVRGITIEWEGAVEPASAYYLFAWLERSLRRNLERSLIHAGPCGRPRVKSVRLTGEGIEVAMNVEQNRSAQIESDGQRRITMMPELSECELLAEELSILGVDPIYESVVAHLPRLLEPAA